MTFAQKAAATLVKVPIRAYRYTVSAFIGRECRYLPTCSEYAEDAIDRNGAWKGFWLALSRICRCNPWGPGGFDPAPDVKNERHPVWAPWRYGRWSGRHLSRELDKKR